MPNLHAMETKKTNVHNVIKIKIGYKLTVFQLKDALSQGWSLKE